jgi:hypothetical protein
MIFRESSDRQTFRRFFGNLSVKTTVQTESRRNFPPVRFLCFFPSERFQLCFAAQKASQRRANRRKPAFVESFAP